MIIPHWYWRHTLILCFHLEFIASIVLVLQDYRNHEWQWPAGSGNRVYGKLKKSSPRGISKKTRGDIKYY
jgi:hypothetical protein